MHHATDPAWLAQECAKANSFAELVPIAMSELHKYAHGVEVVCGPISTGGRGSIDANIAVFTATIAGLREHGRPVFNPVPYEDRIFFFKKRWYESSPENAGKYYMPILEEFYLPLIQTGRIKRGWFIPGWESSFGAQWERQQLTDAGAEIFDITNEWIDHALAIERM